MQQVIYPEGKLKLPIGWAILKKGAKIKEGDKYFNIDKRQWVTVSDEDCTTRVVDVPDVVIRKKGEEPVTDFNEDPNYQPEIPENV